MILFWIFINLVVDSQLFQSGNESLISESILNTKPNYQIKLYLIKRNFSHQQMIQFNSINFYWTQLE